MEIIRCLLQDPRLLIMDEPTSVLTPQAVRTLFKTLRKLSNEGCSILYISHKLDEIRELCHSATVLRAGRVTGHCTPSEETPESMASLMIGKALPVCEHGQPASGGELRLRIAGLSHASPDPFEVDLKDLHLDVHAGEIVGIAGVSGNGQQELLRALSGEEPLAEKHPVQICGVEAGRLSPVRRRRLGMTFVPEERLGRGAVPSLSLADNAILAAARTQGLVRRGLVDFFLRPSLLGWAARSLYIFGYGTALSSVSPWTTSDLRIIVVPLGLLIATPVYFALGALIATQKTSIKGLGVLLLVMKIIFGCVATVAIMFSSA